MAEKMKSLITKINLRDAATFHNVTVDELTYVNFFFGKNGAEKSTLASSISNPACQEWDPQVNPANYTILTYNQDFINRELPDYGNVKGVFTLSKENAETRAQIDAATAQRDAIAVDGKSAGTARDNKKKELEPLLEHFQGECWDTDPLKAFRKRFDKALTGLKRKQLLADKILTNDYSPVHHEEEDIQKVYDIAYDANARTTTYLPLRTLLNWKRSMTSPENIISAKR